MPFGVGFCAFTPGFILDRRGVTTELMVTFPVSVIPSFLVPLFILLRLRTFTRIARTEPSSRADGGGVATGQRV